MKYPTQNELPLNRLADATPEEVKQWEQTDYFRRGDFDVMQLFVVIPALIQIGMFGLMLGIFWINHQIF